MPTHPPITASTGPEPSSGTRSPRTGSPPTGWLAWAGTSFPDAPPDLAGDIAAFLSQLEAFDLLEAASPGVGAEATTKHPAIATPAGPYESPEVTPFGELEKLILSGE